ncbi:hypothetical protein RGUI_3166 [Rhodovulum sp. P5]|nr:hypothetical protein RGUI_3166 [Rhodovulum sp. P5]
MGNPALNCKTLPANRPGQTGIGRSTRTRSTPGTCATYVA